MPIATERLELYVEEWGASYGSPYLIDDEPHEDEFEPAILVENGPEFLMHSGLETPAATALAFVDGVRRAEAWLYRVASDGSTARAVAGAYATGAVICDPDRSPAFAREHVVRLVIWGSGASIALPAVAGGWRWETASIGAVHPDAPLASLQNRMREAERDLAAGLAQSGHLVVLDGPLNFVIAGDARVAGYVKTHHRRFLAPEFHARVPRLGVGERTSLFTVGERYSCYVRIAEPGPQAGPWSGIVRLHIAGGNGLDDAIRLAGLLTARLPSFAGVAYADPRAPQNLQPIGALENHLRHLMGDRTLAARAVRAAAAGTPR